MQGILRDAAIDVNKQKSDFSLKSKNEERKRQRAAVVASEFQEHKKTQIANAFGITLKDVEKLQQLREESNESVQSESGSEEDLHVYSQQSSQLKRKNKDKRVSFQESVDV